MSAWHGSQELKDRIVARMRQHRAADAFIQGLYQRLDTDLPLGYRGCAIGCLLDKRPDLLAADDAGQSLDYEENRWHLAVEEQFGIPYDLADEIDTTFEYFTDGEDAHTRASDFAVAVVEAIPVGADLSGVVEAHEDWWRDLTWDDSTEDNRAAKLIELIAAAPVAVTT